jgi:hypothetical protein
VPWSLELRGAAGSAEGIGIAVAGAMPVQYISNCSATFSELVAFSFPFSLCGSFGIVAPMPTGVVLYRSMYVHYGTEWTVRGGQQCTHKGGGINRNASLCDLNKRRGTFCERQSEEGNDVGGHV